MTIKISDTLANAMLKGKSVEQQLRGGFIRIFSGTVPGTADEVATGATLLATIAADTAPVDAGVIGLLFGAPSVRGISKDGSQTWAGRVVLSGTATFFRFCSAIIETPVQLAGATGGGGSLAAATYHYVVAAYNGSDFSLRSNQISLVTSASGTNTINWTQVDGATGYRIYRTTTTNNYATSTYYDVTASVTTPNILGTLIFSDSGAAGTGTNVQPYTGDPGTAASTTHPRMQGSVGTSGTDIILSAVVLTDNDSNNVGLSTFEIRVAP